MKTIGKKGLSGVIEVVLVICMILGILITVSLPFLIPMLNYVGSSHDFTVGAEGLWYEKYLLTLGGSAILAELMLWQAKALMHQVNNGTVFTMGSAKRIKKIGILCLIMAVFYFVLLFLGMTKFAIMVVCVVFLLIGLILLVFAELFRQATIYKEENDMTI